MLRKIGDLSNTHKQFLGRLVYEFKKPALALFPSEIGLLVGFPRGCLRSPGVALGRLEWPGMGTPIITGEKSESHGVPRDRLGSSQMRCWRVWTPVPSCTIAGEAHLVVNDAQDDGVPLADAVLLVGGGKLADHLAAHLVLDRTHPEAQVVRLDRGQARWHWGGVDPMPTVVSQRADSKT